MSRLMALGAAATYPTIAIVLAAALSGACARGQHDTLVDRRHTAWGLTHEPAKFSVMTACPECLYATHPGDACNQVTMSCVTCAEVYAASHGDDAVLVQPYGQPEFVVYPAD